MSAVIINIGVLFRCYERGQKTFCANTLKETYTSITDI